MPAIDTTFRRLKGKVALVTGGSRGIGAAIARRLAAEGADVAISYIASADKANGLALVLEACGSRAEAFKADQAVGAQVTQLIQNVVARFGRLDILVNNAGVIALGAVNDPATDFDLLDRLYAVNVMGVIAATREAVKHIRAGGRIINIGSVAADRCRSPGGADYAATKAAVAALTRGWSRDLGPKRITVNLVQPGPVDTDMNPVNGPVAPILTALTSIGRYGEAKEIAAAVAFLASSEADYVTGITLNVDGGAMA